MQEIIVGAIVLFACWAVLKRYLPRSVRIGLAQRLSDVAARLGWQKMAQRLRSASMAVSAKGSCGGCSSCESGSGKVNKVSSASITPEALKNTIRR